MATRPRERFTLTALSREAGVNKATVLRIVRTLARLGLVHERDDDKTYGLGAALIALGRAAESAFASVQLARPHVQELSARFDAPCTVSVVDGDFISVLDRAGAAKGLDPSGHPGDRYRFAAPLGLSCVVWMRDELVQRWVDARPRDTISPDLTALDTVKAAAREQGYIVERLTDTFVSLHDLLRSVAGDQPPSALVRSFQYLADTDGREVPGSTVAEGFHAMLSSLDRRHYLPGEMRAGGQYPVRMVAAPTYDADGGLDLQISLFPLRVASAAEIDQMTEALVAATTDVTAKVGGHDPWANQPAGNTR